MNDSKNDGLATSSSAAELERPTTLLRARAQMPTLIGVAPAAPIVTGRPTSVPALRVAPVRGVDPPAPASDAPASRVRARTAPTPVASAAAVPLSPMAPKHSLDAIAIGKEALPVVRLGRRRRGVVGVTLVATAVLALLVTVGWRRVHARAAAPVPVVTATAISPADPPGPSEAPGSARAAPAPAPVAAPAPAPAAVPAPAPAAAPAPVVGAATSPARPGKRPAKPPRKTPALRKHPPKSGARPGRH